MGKRTVLWVGDGGVSTGFARVNHSIIENLPPMYDIYHLAVNFRGDWTETKPWHKLFPASLGGDYLGYNRIKSFIEKYKPDLIFILGDLWIIKTYLSLIKDYDIPIVIYFPVDASVVDEDWIVDLHECASINTYTNYARNEVLKTRPDLSVNVVPHGVDLTKFFKVDKTMACGLLDNTVNPNDWTVFNGNRNQPRKRIDLTIRGFCEFAKDKPANVRLYLHTGLEDSGYRIDKLMRRYGESKRLYITSPHLSPANSVSVKVLNLIYNATDIGINTSLGEGWGLVPFEQAAAGKPQLVPANSANLEIFADGRGVLMPVKDECYITPKILTEGTVPSVNTIAESLQYAYDHPKEMQEMADSMYDYVHLPDFQWDVIAETWHNIFSDLLR